MKFLFSSDFPINSFNIWISAVVQSGVDIVEVVELPFDFHNSSTGHLHQRDEDCLVVSNIVILALFILEILLVYLQEKFSPERTELAEFRRIDIAIQVFLFFFVRISSCVSKFYLFLLVPKDEV